MPCSTEKWDFWLTLSATAFAAGATVAGATTVVAAFAGGAAFVFAAGKTVQAGEKYVDCMKRNGHTEDAIRLEQEIQQLRQDIERVERMRPTTAP